MSPSSIEWTQITWNPTTGCDQISTGCDNCYALTLAKRLKAMGAKKYQHDGDPRTSGPGFAVTTHPDVLTQPLRWRTPRLVFVNSMSDLGHARVPRSFVASVFAVMALAAQHTFQLLTKRPNRLRALLADHEFWSAVDHELNQLTGMREDALGYDWPLPNVWIGTSIESDEYSWRAGELRRIPAATRFLSLEPLLGPLPTLDLADIDWVIAGDESGPRHRPVDPDWVRDIRDRCTTIGVPFFFKQWGGHTPKAGGRELDGRTWDAMPATDAATARGAR
ncbi:MAG: DUF5131 family protein [Pseudonocardiaceae bacterium]